MKKITVGVILVLIVIISLLFYFRVIWLVYPDREMYPVRGIDVSHYQGEIDWYKVVEDDVSFAFIKATEADDFQDPLFTENIKAAQGTGIKTSAYHYYSLAYGGEIQAQNFLKTISGMPIRMAIAVDLEYAGNSKVRPTKEEFQKEFKKFLDVLATQNAKPILYTTYEFYNDYLYPELIEDPIWIRDVNSKPNKDIKWYLWQYNPRGRVDGIRGPVDLNVFNGTQKEFRNF